MLSTQFSPGGKDFLLKQRTLEQKKIDSTMLNTFGIVVTAFSVMDKANQIRFFEENFLVANVSLEVVLRIFFLTLSCANVDFSGQELRWKT